MKLVLTGMLTNTPLCGVDVVDIDFAPSPLLLPNPYRIHNLQFAPLSVMSYGVVLIRYQGST